MSLIMLTLNSLILLVKHYHTENNKNCFKDAINLASKELDNVLNETREYPPFIYYLILENMDNNPKNDWGWKKFRQMSKEEKIEVFNDTINELYNISNS